MAVYTYNSDAIGNCKIRMSVDKLPLSGGAASGSRTEVFAAATGSRRKRTGIRARGFTWSTNIGTPAIPNMRYIFVPVLDPLNVSAIPNTATYKGKTYDRGAFRGEDL
jgi:hypothetical protein